jgi:predicted aspartyl protease
MRNQKQTISIALISWIFAVTLSYADETTTEIPFRLHREHFIVVAGSIGGLEDLNLVIDTGATRTVVSKKVAKKLGLKGETRQVIAVGRKTKIREVVLPDLGLGTIRFPEIKAQVGRLSFVHGLRVDALIGLDLLKMTNLGINYVTNTLTFGAVQHSESSMGFYNRLPFVMIRLEVNGQVLSLMLDSGAGNDLILFRDRVQGRLSWHRTDESRTIQHLGGKTELRGVELSDIRMGASSWATLEAMLLEEKTAGYGTLDGILGTGALELASIQLDFQNSLLSWSK